MLGVGVEAGFKGLQSCTELGVTQLAVLLAVARCALQSKKHCDWQDTGGYRLLQPPSPQPSPRPDSSSHDQATKNHQLRGGTPTPTITMMGGGPALSRVIEEYTQPFAPTLPTGDVLRSMQVGAEWGGGSSTGGWDQWPLCACRVTWLTRRL